jgi:DNA-binding XRE family transcriptional regulator
MSQSTTKRTALAHVRRERGLTQHALSALSGVPRITIARIEIRQHLPVVTTAFALADALETTVDALFREEVERARTRQESSGAAATARSTTHRRKPDEVRTA